MKLTDLDTLESVKEEVKANLLQRVEGSLMEVRKPERLIDSDR